MRISLLFAGVGAALLLALRPASALIEAYHPTSPVVFIKELQKSTVTLSEVKLYVRGSKDSLWEEMQKVHGYSDYSDSMQFHDEERDMKVEMMVFEAKSKEWTSLTRLNSEDYVSKNAQFGSKVNFLWTSTNPGHHMFVLRVFSNALKPHEEVGVEAIIYEGRPEDPSIYSHTDSQIRHKEKRIAECINVSKEIAELQSLDQQGEEEYGKVTNSIFTMVLLAGILKFVFFPVSFLVINRKIQEFYIAKKIIT